MASPFKKKSPLNAYKHSLTSSYANPKAVIQPIVEADAAKAIGDASKKVLSVYSKIEADKKAKKASDEAGDLKHQRDMEIKWGKGNTGPAVKPASHGENMSRLGLKSFKDIQVEKFLKTDYGKPTNTTGSFDLVEKGRKGKGSHGVNVGNRNKYTYEMAYNNLSPSDKKKYGSLKGFSEVAEKTAIPGSKNYADEFGKRDKVNSTPWTPPQMKGSPNKLIGDTMDPYGQINKNDLTRIVDPNQPQALGNRDFRFNQDPIAPGRLGSASNVNTQNQIFGGGQAQTAAEQLQTPLYDKGHGTKQAHTHPSKTTTKMKPDGEYPGARYVKGDYVDEDDLEEKTNLNVNTATLVKSDKKGTFIKEMPDDELGSDIHSSKGFGKKIRLNNMGRSIFTLNEGDQLDPHNFLFQKTPKKSK